MMKKITHRLIDIRKEITCLEIERKHLLEQLEPDQIKPYYLLPALDWSGYPGKTAVVVRQGTAVEELPY